MLSKDLDFYKAELARVEEILKCQDSFHAFVKAAWPVIEGNKPFMDSWHIGAVCEHLEALHRLEIRKLIIKFLWCRSRALIFFCNNFSLFL